MLSVSVECGVWSVSVECEGECGVWSVECEREFLRLLLR